MIGRTPGSAFVVLVAMAGGLTTSGSTPFAAQEVPAAAAGGPLAFTSVQPELLAMPNSLSNAWGDYDNDGDLDLAVSLGSGEVRLYRNDAGSARRASAPRVGMPQAGGQEFRGLSWGDSTATASSTCSAAPPPRKRSPSSCTTRAASGSGTSPPRSGSPSPTGRRGRPTWWTTTTTATSTSTPPTGPATTARSATTVAGSRPSSSASGRPTPAPRSAPAGSTSTTMGISTCSWPTSRAPTDAMWRNDGDSFTDVAEGARDDGAAAHDRRKAAWAARWATTTTTATSTSSCRPTATTCSIAATPTARSPRSRRRSGWRSRTTRSAPTGPTTTTTATSTCR